MSDEFDIDFEAEAEESGSLEKAAARIKKLKAELEACKQERQEYLDGWQRMRADVANQKKEDVQRHAQLHERAVEEVLEDMLPALDAFDMAMQGAPWQAVDANWRSGVEYIRGQLVSALEKHGITVFGVEGEPFDTTRHEAVSGGDAEGAHTVLKVLRTGYRCGDRIIRPAQVTVS
jgi:molecular chaperone GrpE